MAVSRINRSPELDPATIRELVKTWPMRQLRGISVPPPPGDTRDPEWSWSYERKYGAPNARDREASLRIVLSVLARKGRRDIRAIVAALHKIKGLAFEDALLGFIRTHQRQDAEEADIVRRNLTKWLARAVRLHKRLNNADLSAGLRFRRAYERMLTALNGDETATAQEEAARDWILSPRPAGAVRRRSARGNPDEVVVKEAHRLLTEAKVPKEHHRELLLAIGLLQPRGNVSQKKIDPPDTEPA